MDKFELVPPENNTRRRLVIGLGILALMPLLRFPFFRKKPEVISCAPEKAETIKLLTEDGRLVEVAISKISSSKQKASTKEVMGWIKRKALVSGL